MLDALRLDLRLAVRSIKNNWLYTLIVISTLALGISGTTAIFSVVDGILLRPLPYRNADRIVYVWLTEASRNIAKSPFSVPELRDYREQNKVFEGMAAYYDTSINVSFADQPEQVAGARVTSNLFELLGEQPLLGRNFRPEEEQFGNHRVVMLSYAIWQRRFGGDPGIVGQTIRVNGNPHVVLGVMPAGFSFPDRRTELWAPLALNPATPEPRDSRWVIVIALPKPGATLDRADADVKAIAGRLAQDYPENKGVSVALVPLRTELLGDIELPLHLLLGAILLVLLIVCANVAGMMLAKGAAREKEMAIRLALGASRGRLVRYLMTESVLLALLGGLLGTLLAVWAVALLRDADPGNIPRLQEVGVSGRMLVFTLAVSLLTSLLFGLAPALHTTKPNLQGMLKEGRRSAALTSTGRRLFHLLTVSEVSLALVLLIGAALLVGSFLKLLHVDPGFQPDNTLTMEITLSGAKYPESQQVATFFSQLVERVAALPGVQSAGATQCMPLGSGDKYYMLMDSQESAHLTTREGSPPAAFFQVTPGYFQTMKIPLLKGRSFTTLDNAQSPPVAIISQKAAQLYFPSGDPVGKTVRLGSPSNWGPWLNVVGVVPDVRFEDLNRPPSMQVYTPHAQGLQVGAPFTRMVLAARTNTSDPTALAAAIKAQVWALDKDQPVTRIATLERLLKDSLSQRRLIMFMLGAFATMALILAALGIYGTLSYLVTQRRHEIGIRLALGARWSDIFRLVMWQGMRLTLVGIVVGLFIAYVLSRLLTSLLYGVSPSDPATFFTISLVVVGVALIACYVPARRAVRVDPMVELRNG
jgi:putative ABC transport system permease protein